jgi:hypothetical protein
MARLLASTLALMDHSRLDYIGQLVYQKLMKYARLRCFGLATRHHVLLEVSPDPMLQSFVLESFPCRHSSDMAYDHTE